MEKMHGTGNNQRVFPSNPGRANHHLLKLHGNIDNAAERVLSAAEYNHSLRESGGDVNMTFPLPQILDSPVLELQSPVHRMQPLRRSNDPDVHAGECRIPAESRRCLTITRCFPVPADEDRRRTINRRLGDANITPLWYPEGEHEHVEQMLELLLD